MIFKIIKQLTVIYRDKEATSIKIISNTDAILLLRPHYKVKIHMGFNKCEFIEKLNNSHVHKICKREFAHIHMHMAYKMFSMKSFNFH